MIGRRRVLTFAAGTLAARLARGDDRASDVTSRHARWVAGVAPLHGIEPTVEWRAFADLESERWQSAKARLSSIDAWAGRELRTIASSLSLFYPFAGPDALHALALFPAAPRMLLAGLEPVGAVPDPARVPSGFFGRLGRAMGDLHRLTFFRTQEMQSDFAALGVVPAIVATIVRLGGNVTEVYSLSATSARIAWTNASGTSQRLDYIQGDLSNAGISSRPDLAQAIDACSPHATLVKSAMFLLAESRFSTLRRTILDRSPLVVQDDTGIPFRYFDERWATRLFGHYEAPGTPFELRHQPDLDAAYVARRPHSLPFGIGYHVLPARSNLLVATRGGA